MAAKRIHSLEHAPAEGAGKIRDWAVSRGHVFATTRLDLAEALPSPSEFDLLVIMGGAMNVYQHRDYPWLVTEKELIARAIDEEKALLGVCLGAQLIADALGSRVVQNPQLEIGWYPVRFVDRDPPFDGFLPESLAFHWHGDTFNLPPGARRIAESDGCANQAFLVGDRIAGLQFHVEVTPAAASAFCEGAEAYLQPARFVQTRAEIERAAPDLSVTDAGLYRLLDQLASEPRPRAHLTSAPDGRQLKRMRPLLPALLCTMPLLAADFPAPSTLPVAPSFPDALVARDGTTVKTREQWEKTRKPELRALFEHYMYGQQPAKRPVQLRELLNDPKGLGSTATVREFAVDVGLDAPVHLLVVTPNKVNGKVPCFLGLNFHGNHQVINDRGVALPHTWVRPNKDGSGGKTAREQDRGNESDIWNVAQTIQRGYAFATFFQSDVVPDDKELAEAVLRKIGGAGGAERGPADTATIMAWAWGFSRMLDALEQLPEIDAARVATVGHSRNGKTALVAAAFDDRFAMALACQAGCGGTAPSRVSPELAKPNGKGRPTAETLGVINKAFPHWFAGNFKEFNEEPARLPFDQHGLIALCAPRPMMSTCATEDLWANPEGQFEMLKAADPVYQLVAGDGLGASARPDVNKPLLSRLGYFIRPGTHAMTKAEWDVWLDYADKWLKK